MNYAEKKKLDQIRYFALFAGGILAYIGISNADIHWGGFISMMIFFAFTYYLGAFTQQRNQILFRYDRGKRSMPFSSEW
ncbi:hypothetical protein PO124_19535 [Bacillus licheniformis]|nr:hypothetical protein [Bacillus licheniformis]